MECLSQASAYYSRGINMSVRSEHFREMLGPQVRFLDPLCRDAYVCASDWPRQRGGASQPFSQHPRYCKTGRPVRSNKVCWIWELRCCMPIRERAEARSRLGQALAYCGGLRYIVPGSKHRVAGNHAVCISGWAKRREHRAESRHHRT